MALKIETDNPHLPTMFDSDWSSAEALYHDAIQKGLSPDDASAVYLQPIANKWKVIQQSPALTDDPARLRQVSDEFDQKNQAFLSEFNKYNRDNGKRAFGETLSPALAKLSLQANMPQTNKITDQDESEILRKVFSGEMSASDALQIPGVVDSGPLRSILRRQHAIEQRPKPLSISQKMEAGALQAKLNKAETNFATPPTRLAEIHKQIEDFQNNVLGEAGAAAPATGTGVAPLTMTAPPGAAATPAAPTTDMAPTNNRQVGAAPTVQALPAPGLEPRYQPGEVENLDNMAPADQAAAIASLPFNGRYSINGRVFQVKHPSPLQPGSRMTIGDQTMTGTPLTPAAPPPTVGTPAPATMEPLTFGAAPEAMNLQFGTGPGELPMPTGIAPAAPATATPAAPKSNGAYHAASEVKADYKAGRLTKDQAAKILREQFGLE